MLSHKEQIGRLDRRIIFQRPVFGQDASNQKKIAAWVNIPDSFEAFAKVDETGGNEILQAEQLNGIKSAKFTVRYREDLDLELRILYKNVPYNVKSITEVGRKRYLEIMAVAGGHYADNASVNAFQDSQYSQGYD
jgi:SPP1 family predicted phage head-tail adaptor